MQLNNKENLLFPNYMEIGQTLPLFVWQSLRLLVVVTVFVLCYLLIVDPKLGLFIMWKFAVPLLPLVFFLAPGIWRNICPMASINQLPRKLNFSFAYTTPTWFKTASYVVAILILFTVVSLRKIIFNYNGFALAIMIFSLLIGAFIMGIIFKGKSGWCGGLCPLNPVQRVYGQTPMMTVPNNHCQPCVSCTKNCYDFKPSIAYLADIHDKDQYFVGDRKLFISAFPGFILAFYLLPDYPYISILELFIEFGSFMIFSVGFFYFLETFIRQSSYKLISLYVIACINLYYWFNIPVILTTVGQLSDSTFTGWSLWSGRFLILVMSLVWFVKTLKKENQFISLSLDIIPSRTKNQKEKSKNQNTSTEYNTVTIKPDNIQIKVEKNTSLLTIFEKHGQAIVSSCRMGVCGADPVTIISGMDNLSQISDDERATLERLGLEKNSRMACCAKVLGDVTVEIISTQEMYAPSNKINPTSEKTLKLKRIVIIGHGIAGLTAAMNIRRNLPQCNIELIGEEKYTLYDRKAIARLIYERSTVQNLFMFNEDWYNNKKIDTWFNTKAIEINSRLHYVKLATGEKLSYDKLILAMGSSSFIPQIKNSNINGCFSLRLADNAMDIRQYVQEHSSKTAVVLGGGLLGVEAAYALSLFGLQVTILERSNHLLNKQLDDRSGYILKQYIESLGIHVALNTNVAIIKGNEKINSIKLKNGTQLACDVFLMAIGNCPNIAIAKTAGISVNKGVLVNNEMQTNDPDTYAIGDLAELKKTGKIEGLWNVAQKQAEIAVSNIVGDKKSYSEQNSITSLKVKGISLYSIGDIIIQDPQIQEIVFDDVKNKRYLRVNHNGKHLTSAILIGHPSLIQLLSSIISNKVDIKNYIKDIKENNWISLKTYLS
jgi:NADPH-dependent 2,4-dienoyl-CoA reductase/sulfur reductase-like enzyme/ferredoxin